MVSRAAFWYRDNHKGAHFPSVHTNTHKRHKHKTLGKKGKLYWGTRLPTGWKASKHSLQIASLSIEGTEEILGKTIAENKDCTEISIRSLGR